ncbi:serine hydroxymethyltransferase [Faunimonas pinastri]|uniref:Serine hydroxymethyltransferase n=1 Tax=Faunimonas pinastri TaxID=1855383 RepID=A0A1H9DXD5_9HYPH|nr:aminotransferase class I/II-fold pyridoxal phosphate-dependent enzyme [Faunimonas pinastri]SEQ17957.1 serine hydroxymethyltransferase [Faunimonas pinastri]
MSTFAQTSARDLFRAAEEHENYRVAQCLNLVASQNRVSPEVMRLMGSSFAGKFSSGEFGARAHAGAKWIDRMETVVHDLASRLFAPYRVELRPPAGSIANETALLTLARPGDVIVAPSSLFGGHASVRPEGFAGLMGLRILDLPFSADGLEIDLDALEAIVRRERPRLIVIGTAKILFPYPVRDIVEIAQQVGADVFYDAAHVVGLIAGHAFQDPLGDGATLLTGSTQKTFPGPVGGLIVSREDAIADRIRKVARVRLDNYQNNRVAALGYVFAEMVAFGPELATAILTTARNLAETLAGEGLSMVGARLGYTASHMVLIDISQTAEGAQARLEQIGLLTTVTDVWPDRPGGPPRQCLRIGANEIARLGFDDGSVRELASIIARALQAQGSVAELRNRVTDLIRSHGQIARRFCL